MTFELTNGGFTLVQREMVEVVSSYEHDDLIAQRAAVQSRRDDAITQADAELARLDALLTQITLLGVPSRAAMAWAPVPVEGVPAPVVLS